MRDIKFRAWDKAKNMMVNPIVDENKTDGTACLDINNALDFTEHNYELMQYTGLTDKNGKEIYEGDIIKQSVHIFSIGNEYEDEYEDDFYETGIVKIIASKGAVITNIIKTREDVDDKEKIKGLVKNIRKYRSEIIGNIYENPSLLKESK